MTGANAVGLGGLRLAGVGAVLDPVGLTLLGVLAPCLPWWRPSCSPGVARRCPMSGWGCGGLRTSPRMQYTATSYAEPLMRIFDDVLQPARDVEVTDVAESRYLAERVQYRQAVDDVIEVHAYAGLIKTANRLADRARGIQNGSIHRYLAFSFGALLIVLLVVSR